jgi:hypothetical protein
VHRIHLALHLPGQPLGDQDQAHPGVSQALGQELPGLGDIRRGASRQPGQSEGQQGAGVGDDEKA